MTDKLLQIIARVGTTLANSTDGRSEQGITLLYGGMLVTGIIISPEEYMLSHDILDLLQEGRHRLQDEYQIPEDHDGFIHLKKAVFFVPGQQPFENAQGIFWRGRIDSVDGFTLGRCNITMHQVRGNT